MRIILNSRNNSIDFAGLRWKDEPTTLEQALKDVEPFDEITSAGRSSEGEYVQARRHYISELV